MTSICIAPAGKFRVVQIDEKEKRHSIVEADYTTIIKDCDSKNEADSIMKKARGLNLQRLIYDEKGECVGNFRESKADEYLRYLNEGFGVYPWGEAREND